MMDATTILTCSGRRTHARVSGTVGRHAGRVGDLLDRLPLVRKREPTQDLPERHSQPHSCCLLDATPEELQIRSYPLAHPVSPRPNTIFP